MNRRRRYKVKSRRAAVRRIQDERVRRRNACLLLIQVSRELSRGVALLRTSGRLRGPAPHGSPGNPMMPLSPIAQALVREVEVIPIDPTRGTDGPCEFWTVDTHGRKYLMAREIAPGGPYEHD